MARRLIVVMLMTFGVALLAPLAQADTGNIIESQEPEGKAETAQAGWQGGNCTKDTPQCSAETPGQYFKQAGGHPPIGFTQYTVKHSSVEPIKGVVLNFPVGSVRTLRTDLPAGLTVNPQSTATKCSLEVFKEQVEKSLPTSKCPPTTIVGQDEVTLVTTVEGVEIPPGDKEPLPKGATIPPNPLLGTLVAVYNLVPAEGEPALYGFVVAGKEEVFLTTEVAWQSDYHESFRIELPNSTPPFATLTSRLVNFGTGPGHETFITNPTTCFDPTQAAYKQTYSNFLRADSYNESAEEVANFPNGYTAFEAPLPKGVQQEGCEKVPFEPAVEVEPGTKEVDSPSGPAVITEIPFNEGGSEISQSQLKTTKLTLPQGMGLNPSAANGLQSCTNAQLGKGTRNPVTCPAGSKIGTVEIETPPLPPGSLSGNLYLGQQLSRDPTSGEEFRVFLDAESARYGISMRMIGNISANPKTGQLTTTFAEAPQVPFTSVKLQFEAAKAVLTSPPTCGPNETVSSMEPWATPASTKTPSSKFILTSYPGGGVCPKTLGARPFAPSYEAKTDSTTAGAYSPFRIHIGRPDGQQELKGVNVTLPPGLTGNLTGIPYCPESQLAAAAANSGAAEQANPSCSSESMIATTSTEAGTGNNPLKMAGKAYLGGPYKGAPLSMAVITPAVAGPFDLGTVVIRVALFINPETAQINAVSDPIPDVFGGVKLDIRAVNVNVDRAKFTLNPTNCNAAAIAGTLSGGGSDPTNPASFSSYPVSVPFQATGCNTLPFKPRLFTRLLGGPNTTHHSQHPPLRAILETRQGDANVLRSALTLPSALILDQGHIKKVCTRPQLAAQECPSSTVYGEAEAKSPVLSGKLKGPVYLVPSGGELPNLVADLRGQVNIQLHGVISSKRGGLKTVFYPSPDVPVSKFTLLMDGGKKGLLVNTTNLCSKPRDSYMNIKGQNDKNVINKHLPLKVSGCSKGK
jgi:hypothetical protein